MTSHPSQSLSARTEPLMSDDPREVGGYRIQGRVADLGGGVLYAARRNGGEPVLLGLAAGTEAAEALPEPRDRGVCAVAPVDSGAWDGRPWAVLPDQPGPTLRGRVASRGALPVGDAVVLAAAVAEALAVLHAEGTVHGEVGPDAPVLTGAGPRLLDTGLGRRAAAPRAPGLRGMPGWVAPEVYEDGRPTGAADVFGWACLVVLAVTGREPFGASPATRLGRRAALVEMERRARQDAVDLEGVPEGLRAVVARALSPEPGERPPAGEALAAALRHLDGRDADPTAARLRAVLPAGGGESPEADGTEAGAAAEAPAAPPAATPVPDRPPVAQTGAATASAAVVPGTASVADTVSVTASAPPAPGPVGAGPVHAPSAPGAVQAPLPAAVPGPADAPRDTPAGGAPGFGIYTDPVTPEGSAFAPAPAVPAPAAGRGIFTAPAFSEPAPGWGHRPDPSGDTATLEREPSADRRAALLANAVMAGAVLLAVLLVMLFRTGVL
ncbi:serine/threonine protein kinase [Nocardiopsis flavescens]